MSSVLLLYITFILLYRTYQARNGGYMNKMEIGNRIKKLRKELHITQTDIKNKCGISSGNLSNIERGNILPSASALISLSDILGCTTDYILKGDLATPSTPTTFDSEEDQIMNMYRQLSDNDKEEIYMLLAIKTRKNNGSKKASAEYIPSYANSESKMA